MVNRTSERHNDDAMKKQLPVNKNIFWKLKRMINFV